MQFHRDHEACKWSQFHKEEGRDLDQEFEQTQCYRLGLHPRSCHRDEGMHVGKTTLLKFYGPNVTTSNDLGNRQ